MHLISWVVRPKSASPAPFVPVQGVMLQSWYKVGSMGGSNIKGMGDHPNKRDMREGNFPLWGVQGLNGEMVL